jgi:hypothetical protein
MSLTNGLASAVNTVIERLTGQPSTPFTGHQAPTDHQLVEAVRLLASRAHRTLGVGFDADRAALAVERWLQSPDRPTDPTITEQIADWTDAILDDIQADLDSSTLSAGGHYWSADSFTTTGERLPRGVLTFTRYPDGPQVTVRLSLDITEGRPA